MVMAIQKHIVGIYSHIRERGFHYSMTTTSVKLRSDGPWRPCVSVL